MKTFKIAFALGCLIVLVFLVPTYWRALRAPGIGAYQDDGVYLVTAKALATGRGYRIVSLPGEIPQTKYPILFPLILSAVWRIDPHFPENTLLLKLVPFVFMALWLWLSYRLCKNEHAPELAAGSIVLLTAALPMVVFLGSSLLSETLFATLCTGALISIRRLEEGSSKSSDLFWAAILSGLACLSRSVGVGIVLAGLFVLIRRRSAGKALRYLSIAFLVYAPWFLWVVLQHPAARDPYYSDTNYRAWNILFNFTWPQKLAVLLTNGGLLLASPFQLLGMTSAWVMIAGAFLLIAVLSTWKRITAIHAFVIFYVLLIVVWAWPPTRFMVVIFPLVLLLAWQAGQAGCERFQLNPATAWGLASLIFGLLCIQSAWNLAREKEAIAKSEVAWSRTEDLLGWIRDNTAADSVLLGNLDPMFYLYTGRHAVRAFEADPLQLFYESKKNRPIGTLADFQERIIRNNVQYIIRMPTPDFAEAPFLDRLITEFVARRGNADVVKENGRDSEFVVYRVNRAALDIQSKIGRFSASGVE